MVRYVAAARQPRGVPISSAAAVRANSPFQLFRSSSLQSSSPVVALRGASEPTDGSDESTPGRAWLTGTARPYSHDIVERHVDKLLLAVDKRCIVTLKAVHKSAVRWLLAGYEAVDGGREVGDNPTSKLLVCNSLRWGHRASAVGGDHTGHMDVVDARVAVRDRLGSVRGGLAGSLTDST